MPSKSEEGNKISEIVGIPATKERLIASSAGHFTSRIIKESKLDPELDPRAVTFTRVRESS